jgi:DNA-binding SARP family transcriptional activator
MTTLHIRLLGAFEVLRDGHPLGVGEWRNQQTRTILRVLLARRGRIVPSDQLLEILWPDQDPLVARRRLHVRISQLRKALGAGGSSGCIATMEGGYSFRADADCWIDSYEFEALAQQGRLCQENNDRAEAIAAYEAARALYRGDFLQEDLYADWAFAERERLRERFLTLLAELAECYAQQGRYRRAIACCHQLLAADPCREVAYVRLMLYHYYAGEQAQALRAYERCCQALATEIDVQPLPATADLARQIRDGTLWSAEQAPRYPPPAYEGRLFEVPYSLGHTPLVGREREYAWLVEQWRDAEPRALLIEGEAGIGKSRLADEFLGYVAARGAVVLRSRMVQGERHPYAAVVTALRPLLQKDELTGMPPPARAALFPLFPSLGEGQPNLPTLPELPPEEERRRLFEALATLVRVCAPRGTVLAVDDAHRAGQAACQLLAYLVRVLTVVVIYRSEETPSGHPLRAAFQPLRRQGRLAALTLKRLPPAAVQTLIDGLAGGDLPHVAQQVVTQAAGNPLFVVALLQHMFEEGALYVEAGGRWAQAGDAALSLPSTVRQTIEARLKRLNRDQRRAFDLAAVLGGEFDFALLQSASGMHQDRLLDTVDTLLDAVLLAEPRAVGRREFAVAHDCYAEVAYDTLPRVRCRQLHCQAAEAIEQVYAADLAPHYAGLAYHFGRAGVPSRERPYAKLAGQQAAAQFANDEAVAHLSRALELTAAGEATERRDLLLTLERVHEVLGARQAQLQALAELEALAGVLDDDELRAMVAIRRARYAIVTSDFAAAVLAARDGASLAGKCRDIALEASARNQWGSALINLEDLEAARQQLEAALALARAAQLRWLEGDILRTMGNLCSWQHRFAECMASYEGALSIHRQVGDRRGELSALNNLSVQASRLGGQAMARDWLQQALLICRETGDRFAEAVVLFNLATGFDVEGDFQAARAHYEHSLSIRREIGAREGEVETLTYLGDLFRHQGDYARARAHLEQAEQIAREGKDRRRQARALRGLGLVALDCADSAGAAGCLERALLVLRQMDDHEQSPVLSALSRLHRLTGDLPQACEHSQQALSAAQDQAHRHLEAIAWTESGHVHLASQRPAEAATAYRQALTMRREMGERNLAMEPLAGLARLAHVQGDAPRAQEHVEEVLDHLRTATLDGTEEPFHVYWTCYRVLQAAQDPRAGGLLTAACSLLHERAATIEDEELRRSYLEDVPAHRKLLHECHPSFPTD